MNIIIDAMGGDLAPAEPVRGALRAHRELGCDITLVGREEDIRKVLADDKTDLPEGVTIVNATEVVEICDDPARVCLRKKDSSMSVGLRMVRDGKGDAFISAGSTGALLSGATLIVRRIPGIKRAAVAPVVPTGAGSAVLIDAGANAECTAEYMLQFAFMGSFYAQKVLGRENPRVGLINIGAEPSKGSELYKEVYALLKQAGDAGRINFVGNVEPTSLASPDAVDVLVADGFVGNIVLKTMEGTANFIVQGLKDLFMTNTRTKMGYLMIRGNMGGFKKMLDSRETGGTAFLGVQAPVIKAHGNSDAFAFFNAVKQAIQFVSADVEQEIIENMDHMVLPPQAAQE
ncbi:MAG: phosphate acyltransferase PlsX [Clostridiales bacterium]|nr:phosphate acyltransferase PlsX [Clostridiales bacterium]MCD8367792.1 phosphate acyltransferase PlsX [Clostridiales bacterium]